MKTRAEKEQIIDEIIRIAEARIALLNANIEIFDAHTNGQMSNDDFFQFFCDFALFPEHIRTTHSPELYNQIFDLKNSVINSWLKGSIDFHKMLIGFAKSFKNVAVLPEAMQAKLLDNIIEFIRHAKHDSDRTAHFYTQGPLLEFGFSFAENQQFLFIETEATSQMLDLLDGFSSELQLEVARLFKYDVEQPAHFPIINADHIIAEYERTMSHFKSLLPESMSNMPAAHKSYILRFAILFVQYKNDKETYLGPTNSLIQILELRRKIAAASIEIQSIIKELGELMKPIIAEADAKAEQEQRKREREQQRKIKAEQTTVKLQQAKIEHDEKERARLAEEEQSRLEREQQRKIEAEQIAQRTRLEEERNRVRQAEIEATNKLVALEKEEEKQKKREAYLKQEEEEDDSDEDEQIAYSKDPNAQRPDKIITVLPSKYFKLLTNIFKAKPHELNLRFTYSQIERLADKCGAIIIEGEGVNRKFRFPNLDIDTYDFRPKVGYTIHAQHRNKSGAKKGELYSAYIKNFRERLRLAGITPETCTIKPDEDLAPKSKLKLNRG